MNIKIVAARFAQREQSDENSWEEKMPGILNAGSRSRSNERANRRYSGPRRTETRFRNLRNARSRVGIVKSQARTAPAANLARAQRANPLPSLPSSPPPTRPNLTSRYTAGIINSLVKIRPAASPRFVIYERKL